MATVAMIWWLHLIIHKHLASYIPTHITYIQYDLHHFS